MKKVVIEGTNSYIERNELYILNNSKEECQIGKGCFV